MVVIAPRSRGDRETGCATWQGTLGPFLRLGEHPVGGFESRLPAFAREAPAGLEGGQSVQGGPGDFGVQVVSLPGARVIASGGERLTDGGEGAAEGVRVFWPKRRSEGMEDIAS